MHLQAVADRAKEFATAFGAGEQAYAAGLLHDLGKYADQFLRRLNNQGEKSQDHWTVGSGVLAGVVKQQGLIPAFAIIGHHIGLDKILKSKYSCKRSGKLYRPIPPINVMDCILLW